MEVPNPSPLLMTQSNSPPPLTQTNLGLKCWTSMMKSTFGRGLSRHANILLLLRQRELKMHHRKGNLRTYQVNGCWVYVGKLLCMQYTQRPLTLIQLPWADTHTESPDAGDFGLIPLTTNLPHVRGCIPFDLGLDLFLNFFMFFIQHWFICRPSDFTVSEDAGIEPRAVATSALTVRRSNHSARSHPHAHLILGLNVLILLICILFKYRTFYVR